MKLKIDKRKFKKHIDNISRGMISYSLLPSLQGLLIEANESNVTLITSDGYLSIKEVIANNDGMVIKEPGKILVPSKLFKDIIEKMGETIELTASDSKMTINSEGSHTEVNLFNVEEYPRISFESFGKDLIVDAEEFRNMIKNVAFAAANGDKRIILNGVNIRAKDSKLTVSATDTFRLAQETKDIDSPLDFDITIFSKKIRDFLPSNASGEVIISVDDAKIISKIDATTISSRIIDGVYPPVDKLISNKFTSKIVVDSKEIEKNIDRVTLVTGEGKKTIKLACDENELTFESKKSEIGEAKSKVENFEFQGTPIIIVFDYGFLKEAISKYEGKIAIAFNGPQKPFVIRGVSNKNLIQLILPHRTF